MVSEAASASPYVGGRTLKWLKVKQSHYREDERGWLKTAKALGLTIPQSLLQRADQVIE